MPPRMKYEDVKHLMDAAGMPAPVRVPRKPSRKGGPARDRVPPPPVDDERRPGVVICEGTVYGRPVPWKAPTLGANGGVVHGRDYKRYSDWKATVASAVDAVMARRRPYGGPVRMETVFYLNPDGRTLPDVTNLIKSTEDALQGIVIADDRQVVETCGRRVVTSTERQRAEIVVTAL